MASVGVIGEYSAVPVKLSVDADRRERRRQCARRHDVLDRERHVAAVEIAHRAGAHLRSAHLEPRPGLIDQLEVHKLGQGLVQRHGRVAAGIVGALERL